jgi:hypothetical protein
MEESSENKKVSGKKGRPSYFGEHLVSTNLWLPREMIQWLINQPGGMSETIRNLVKAEQERKSR